jgi:integration host factor subunit beta
MNKSDLINAVKDKADLNRNDAEKVITVFFDSIKKSLVNNTRVEIRGFGSFTVKHYRPYTGRNPKTGAAIHVSPKKLPFFKVGKELKESIDNNS